MVPSSLGPNNAVIYFFQPFSKIYQHIFQLNIEIDF